jgi:hypothetical protein
MPCLPDCQSVMTRVRGFLTALALAASLLLSPAAFAKVTIAFYSHEFGTSFPHAFVTLEGTLEADGKAVDENFGFTAKSITPAILMGNVYGGMDIAKPGYIKNSDRQFAFEISDDQYHAVKAKMVEWRDRPGKSYNMNKRNCVHFVAELAQMLGLKVNWQSELFKKPRSFLIEVKGLNPALK